MNAKLLPLSLFALAAGVAGSSAALAETPTYSIEDVTACSPDAMRLCKDKLPDLDAIEGCMKANYEKLKPACKARFDKEH